MPLKAVLFDLGGTLLHYHDPENGDPKRPFRRVTLLGIQAVLGELAKQGAVVQRADDIKQAIDNQIGLAYRESLENNSGGSLETPIRAGLRELGIGVSNEQWAALRPAFYNAIDQTVSPRLGASETLMTLNERGYRLGLISNTYWAADVHDRHLRQFGLLDLLPVRLYSCDLPHSKPHPSIFRKMLEQVDTLPEDAVYVGDRLDTDIGGAQGAGMRGILLNSPYDPASIGEIHPDTVIDELPELLPALMQFDS